MPCVYICMHIYMCVCGRVYVEGPQAPGLKKVQLSYFIVVFLTLPSATGVRRAGGSLALHLAYLCLGHWFCSLLVAE